MKLITISASNRCYKCGGTGISTSQTTGEGGKFAVVLAICSCVTTRIVKPKSFAGELANELKRKRSEHRTRGKS